METKEILNKNNILNQDQNRGVILQLMKHPIFSNISIKYFEKHISPFIKINKSNHGKIIINEGDYTENLIIIKSGEYEVFGYKSYQELDSLFYFIKNGEYKNYQNKKGYRIEEYEEKKLKYVFSVLKEGDVIGDNIHSYKNKFLFSVKDSSINNGEYYIIPIYYLINRKGGETLKEPLNKYIYEKRKILIKRILLLANTSFNLYKKYKFKIDDDTNQNNKTYYKCIPKKIDYVKMNNQKLEHILLKNVGHNNRNYSNKKSLRNKLISSHNISFNKLSNLLDTSKSNNINNDSNCIDQKNKVLFTNNTCSTFNKYDNMITNYDTKNSLTYAKILFNKKNSFIDYSEMTKEKIDCSFPNIITTYTKDCIKYNYKSFYPKKNMNIKAYFTFQQNNKNHFG